MDILKIINDDNVSFLQTSHIVEFFDTKCSSELSIEEIVKTLEKRIYKMWLADNGSGQTYPTYSLGVITELAKELSIIQERSYTTLILSNGDSYRLCTLFGGFSQELVNDNVFEVKPLECFMMGSLSRLNNIVQHDFFKSYNNLTRLPKQKGF